VADDDESGSAANFLADTPGDRAGLTAHVQASEAAFEARAVRELLKRFAIDPRAWDVREAMGGDARYRFGVFDDVYPRFPVRLGASRAVATALSAKTRRVGNLGFHEVTPAVLFDPTEFRKLRVFKEWNALHGNYADLRPVGLVFGVVNRLFVIHDWDAAYPEPSVALKWLRTDGGLTVEATVEPFPQFLDKVAYHDWRP
jgi:hypothetical protein